MPISGIFRIFAILLNLQFFYIPRYLRIRNYFLVIILDFKFIHTRTVFCCIKKEQIFFETSFFTYSFCLYLYRLGDLKNHLENVHAEPFKCKHCEFSCKSKKYMRTHERFVIISFYRRCRMSLSVWCVHTKRSGSFSSQIEGVFPSPPFQVKLPKKNRQVNHNNEK